MISLFGYAETQGPKTMAAHPRLCRAAISAFFGVLLLAGCAKGPALLPREAFQAEYNGKQTDLYTISDGTLTVQLTNFGARIVSFYAPDRDGVYDDIAVGYENIERYIHNTGNRIFGATVGRVANRIKGASFELDGVEYKLTANQAGNCLHGGDIGMDWIVWDAVKRSRNSVTFHTVVPDGQDGFPGNLDVSVRFSLADGGLHIEYEAATDKPTIVNLTNHTYFNLGGQSGSTVLDNTLWVDSDEVLELTNSLPSGNMLPVDGTKYDFRQAKEMIAPVSGGWLLKAAPEGQVRKVVEMRDPHSGRTLEMLTDQPCVQLYSGGGFKGSYCGKRPDVPIGPNALMAIEAQKPTDAIHHPEFASIVLRPGETYKQHTIYKITTK